MAQHPTTNMQALYYKFQYCAYVDINITNLRTAHRTFRTGMVAFCQITTTSLSQLAQSVLYIMHVSSHLSTCLR